MNKLIFLGLIPVLMLTVPNVYRSSSLSNNQPPINPEFDPDESCQFDVFQDKCVPGTEQECPEGFGTNDPGTCFPVDENGYMDCPDGYHSIDDDETGQCYPNEGGCEYDDMVLLTDRPDKDDRCAALYYL